MFAPVLDPVKETSRRDLIDCLAQLGVCLPADFDVHGKGAGETLLGALMTASKARNEQRVQIILRTPADETY